MHSAERIPNRPAYQGKKPPYNTMHGGSSYNIYIYIPLQGSGSVYITIVIMSAHSGRVTMLSRVVSTTLPAAKCSS